MTTPFKRGARPSPRHKLAAATPHRVAEAVAPQFAVIPPRLDMWGNDTYGCCVSSEEAFSKACHAPEIFIDTATVEAWASAHGVLNGADLVSVLEWMQAKGFQGDGGQLYNDGPHHTVDWTSEAVLQSAIATGPVKIAIAADALPSDAGNRQGWYAVGDKGFRSTDHCVALCGYGPTPWLYQQLGVPQPAGLPSAGYLCYTWSTIGFVDHAWIKGCCDEAWVRSPTTVGVPPLDPTPPPFPPTPAPVPPAPAAAYTMTFSRAVRAGQLVTWRPRVNIAAGTYAAYPLAAGQAGTSSSLVDEAAVGDGVREIVDQMFADLEAHARRPAVRVALSLVQGLADVWLATKGF